MDKPSGPNGFGKNYVWDMNACHTWYRVTYGFGNVVKVYDDLPGAPNLNGSDVWEGDNPPGSNPTGINCGPFFCPVPPQADPNFHP